MISHFYSHFNPNRRTKVVTHGFWGSAYYQNFMLNDAWMQRFKDLFLDHPLEEYNVILVDWRKGAFRLFTPDPSIVGVQQAGANCQVVAAQLARLIKNLCHHLGAKPIDFHLFGHSYGGTIVALTGQHFQSYDPMQRIGRITGLDAPLLCQASGLPSIISPDDRLSPGDAIYVQNIHLTAILFTTKYPLAHDDFYVNGGQM